MMWYMFLFVLFACPFFAYGDDMRSNSKNQEQDLKSIENEVNQFVDAYNKGDVDRLMQVYSKDFVDMSEGTKTISDQEAILLTTDRLRNTFMKYEGDLKVITQDIQVDGDFAFDRGILHVVLKPKEQGDPITFSRRFLEVWKKESDGKWRVICAMDNNLPESE